MEDNQLLAAILTAARHSSKPRAPSFSQMSSNLRTHFKDYIAIPTCDTYL